MAIEVWLTFNNGSEKIMFPVNPSEITVKTSSSHKKVDVQKLGEVMMLQAPNLKGVAFSSFFPPSNQSLAPYVKLPNSMPLLEPSEYVKMITEWKDSLEPCRLIITSDVGSRDSYVSAIDLNILVGINKFDVSEKAGDVGTAHFSIDLTEYKIIRTRTVQIKNDSSTGVATASVSKTTRPVEKTSSNTKEHKTLKGESLWAIGQKYNMKWEDIAKKNNIKAPYIIQIGQVIKL